MSKKQQQTETGVELMSALPVRLQAILRGLTVEEQAELSLMPLDEAVASLEIVADLAESASAAADVTFKEAKPEQVNIPVLTAGSLGLRAGSKFRAYLLGTVHIFSKEIKENWKEFKGVTQTFYYNSYFKFRDVNGKEFGVWSSPTLRILEKIPTHASLPGMVKTDPMVEVSYHGKIEGKERLKQEFGIELTKGNAAHVFNVKVADGVVYNPYIKGCINNLNSPTPVESASAAGISREEATRANYEKLMALQSGSSDVAGFLAQ